MPLARSVLSHPAGFDRIEEHDHPCLSREPDDCVGLPRNRRGSGSKVSGLGERLYAVTRRPVIPATSVLGAQQIDQQRVEARGLAVGDEHGSLVQAEIADQCLRRVAHDENGRPRWSTRYRCVRPTLSGYTGFVLARAQEWARARVEVGALSAVVGILRRNLVGTPTTKRRARPRQQR